MADAITDAMMNAGAAVLRDSDAEWCGTWSEGRAAASAIYLAMEAVRQPQLPSDDGLIKALEGIANAVRIGAETDVQAWANLAYACQHTAREALSRHKAPLSAAGDDVERRPANCRFRLRDEGKPYPRSGCQACGATIATGLGKSCQHAVLTALQVTEGDKQ